MLEDIVYMYMFFFKEERKEDKLADRKKKSFSRSEKKKVLTFSKRLQNELTSLGKFPLRKTINMFK